MPPTDDPADIERFPKTFFMFVDGRWIPTRVGDGRVRGKRATAALIPSFLTVSDVRRDIAPYLADANGPVFVLSDLVMGARGPESPMMLMVKALPGFEGRR